MCDDDQFDEPSDFNNADTDVKNFALMHGGMFSGSGTPPVPDERTQNSGFLAISEVLMNLEWSLTSEVIEKMREPKTCNPREVARDTFGIFWSQIIVPYARLKLGHRAAVFARSNFVPAVLREERSLRREFYKGALFYNVALVHLIIGDHQRFEYFLAMADQEDFRQHNDDGESAIRGSLCLKTDDLSTETVQSSVEFGIQLLNGAFSSLRTEYCSLFNAPITARRFHLWRTGLDGFHHAELFRILFEAELFLGLESPEYESVANHPHVMLRLAKSLAHLAQWIESRLTQLQCRLPSGTITKSTLSFKLKQDPHFASYCTAAGGTEQFSGNNPKSSTDVNTELRKLLTDLDGRGAAVEKEWRLLRLFYLVRNSTAHTIDSGLELHADRELLTQLTHAVMLSAFVIEKCYSGAAP